MFTGEPPEMLTSGQGPPHWQGEGTQAVASAARGAPTSSTYTPYVYVCTTVRAHSTIGPHDLEKRRKWSKEDTYFVKHKFFTSCASATIGAPSSTTPPACTLYVLLLFLWGHICLYISTNKTIFTKNKVLCGMLIRG